MTILDGPSSQGKLTNVGTGTAVEVKVGGSALSDRQVVTIQPVSQDIKVYFAGDGEVPSAATVAANGFDQVKKTKESYEAGFQQKIYIVSSTGTTDVIVAERS